jgi:hypothetical protein
MTFSLKTNEDPVLLSWLSFSFDGEKVPVLANIMLICRMPSRVHQAKPGVSKFFYNKTITNFILLNLSLLSYLKHFKL